jgi:hypothetical protein
MNKDLSAFKMETITVPSANVAATLSSTLYKPFGNVLPTQKALISVNPGPPISWTIDTTTVGSATGHKTAAYGQIEIYGYDNIKNFQTTSFSSGTTGSITATYFR